MIEAAWSKNPVCVDLVGLCPLLAVSDTMVNGLLLGIAMLVTLALSSPVVSMTRHLIPPEVRVVSHTVTIATVVTVIHLLVQAYFPELAKSVGIYLPIIAANCMVTGRAEEYASQHGIMPSLVDGVLHGAGALAILLIIAGSREVLAYGTLFREAYALFGPGFDWLTVTLTENFRGLPIVASPIGGFFALALLLALRNYARAPTVNEAVRVPVTEIKGRHNS